MNKYLEREWNWLVILDCTRFDVFQRMHEAGELGIDGDLSEFDSEATRTIEWYRRHWSKPVPVHLITASPQPSKSSHANGDGPSIKANFLSYQWAWRSGQKSRRAEPDITMWFAEMYQREGERHLLHIVPPHLPFLGPHGIEVMNAAAPNEHRMAVRYRMFREWGVAGHWPEIRAAYMENLLISVASLKDKLHKLKGKVVVTSDHGELLGEEAVKGQGAFYGHPRYKKVGPEATALLGRVPWFEVN